MRRSLLDTAARVTVGLLAVGAFLSILAIFDQALAWDIFSPEVERIVVAALTSCVVLGAFGLAITLTSGILQIVTSIAPPSEPAVASAEVATPSRRKITRFGAGLIAGLTAIAVLIAILHVSNGRILAGRQRTFKRLAEDRLAELSPRLVRELSARATPDATPPALAEIFRTLLAEPCCHDAALFVADPEDASFLWRLERSPDDYRRFVFRHVFVTRDQEKAVRLALQGDTKWLEQMSGDANWIWYRPLRATPKERPLAVVYLAANPNESFRDYSSVESSSESLATGAD